MKTGVKVSIDTEKKIIVSIRKADLAKSSADARPEVFSPGMHWMLRLPNLT